MKLKNFIMVFIAALLIGSGLFDECKAQTDTTDLGSKLQLDGGYKGFHFQGAIEDQDTIYSLTYKVDPNTPDTYIYSKLLEAGAGLPNIKLVRQYRGLSGGWIDVQIYAGDSSEVHKAVKDSLTIPGVECRLVALGLATNLETALFEYLVAYKEPD